MLPKSQSIPHAPDRLSTHLKGYDLDNFSVLNDDVHS